MKWLGYVLFALAMVPVVLVMVVLLADRDVRRLLLQILTVVIPMMALGAAGLHLISGGGA
jgi:hypothetical protein